MHAQLHYNDLLDSILSMLLLSSFLYFSEIPWIFLVICESYNFCWGVHFVCELVRQPDLSQPGTFRFWWCIMYHCESFIFGHDDEVDCLSCLASFLMLSSVFFHNFDFLYDFSCLSQSFGWLLCLHVRWLFWDFYVCCLISFLSPFHVWYLHT